MLTTLGDWKRDFNMSEGIMGEPGEVLRYSASEPTPGWNGGSDPYGEPIPLEKTLQAHIGKELRSLFNHLVQEPVPDRFLELLKKLDDKAEAGK